MKDLKVKILLLMLSISIVPLEAHSANGTADHILDEDANQPISMMGDDGMSIAGTEEPTGLQDKEVVARIYLNWRRKPADFERVILKIEGSSVHFGSLKADNSAVVVLCAADQVDQDIAKVLRHFVYSHTYTDKLKFTFPDLISPLGRQRSTIVRDAVGIPVEGAEVLISLWRFESAEIVFGEKYTGDGGVLKLPTVVGDIDQVRFRISHPKYGTARADRWWPGLGDVILPVVARNTDAWESAIWGFVFDPNNKPVVEATIECKHVGTLGEGGVDSLHGHVYRVITDNNGFFNFYLPNKKARDDRGQFIPLGSEYDVRIVAPEHLGFAPHTQWVTSGEESKITIGLDQYPHRFLFEGADGPINKAEQLAKIEIDVILPNEKRLLLTYDDLTRRRTFPIGTYQARLKKEIGSYYKFRSIVVDQNSPCELVFKLKSEVTAFGRVVHGITGEPMANAFVTGKKVGGAQIHESETVMHTDVNGQFAIKYQPGSVYNFVASQEGYMSAESMTAQYLQVNANGRVNVPTLRLFPAAEAVVRVTADAKHVAVWPRYLINANDKGELAEVTFPKGHRGYININKPQKFYIPVGVRFRVKFDPVYDRRWCPYVVDKVFMVEQSEVIDLGTIRLQRSIEIRVKIVDSAGEIVEGVPIRMTCDKYSTVPHNSDEKGYVRFHVPPNSQGRVWVDVSSAERGIAKSEISFTVGSGSEKEEREFELVVPEAVLEKLFDMID